MFFITEITYARRGCISDDLVKLGRSLGFVTGLLDLRAITARHRNTITR